MSNMRTIRVTGKGNLKVKPDLTRITLSVEGTFPEYGEALRRSSQDTEQLKDLLAKYGFARSDLKRLVGYKFRHQMKVEFESDNDRLGKVLYALAHCAVKPEFRLSYTVKDPEAAKNELLGKAITDACEKAAVLTKAAGITLKAIQNIDYSWGQINFEVQPMNQMLMAEECCEAPAAAYGSYDMDIEPDDIEHQIP